MTSVQLKSQKSIGELIHYYRLIKGYSQKDLANHLHVTISAISSWERGLNKPGLDVAMLIADDIGITLDEFFLYRKPKVMLESHGLSDRLTMSNAYVEIHNLCLIPRTQLQVTLRIKGLSLTKEMIEYYSRQLQVRLDGHVIPVTSSILLQDDEKVSISPELEANTLAVRCFDCITVMPYKPYQDLDLRLTCQDQVERFVIPGSVIRLLTDDHLMNHKNHEQQASLLSSPDHLEVLQYLAKSQNPQNLQDYIKRLYL
jgi:transcriptional regulator with XRE-family HTH domain